MELKAPSSGQLSRRLAGAIGERMAQFDILPAAPEQIDEARKFAAGLIGSNIAQTETLHRVHETTGAGLFIARREAALAGVIAFVLLSDAGLAAVRNDLFDALDPAPDHVASGVVEAAGLYGWGIAAAHPKVARRLLAAYAAMIESVVPHLPVFARPATVLGERMLLRRLNFKPWPQSTTGLVWIEPHSQRECVAA